MATLWNWMWWILAALLRLIMLLSFFTILYIAERGRLKLF